MASDGSGVGSTLDGDDLLGGVESLDAGDGDNNAVATPWRKLRALWERASEPVAWLRHALKVLTALWVARAEGSSRTALIS